MPPKIVDKKRINNMIYRTEQNSLWLTILLWLICIGVFFPYPATASDDIEKSGDVIQVLIPAIAYGTTFYLDDTEGRTQFYKSFFTNLGVTYGLKYTTNKKRPYGGSKSFPSGHTSAAFQGAAFIHRRYGWEYGVPAYIGASFVGYSRVESDNHDIEDVLAGAMIGVVSSFFFTKPYKGITVTPVATKGYYGLGMSANW
jgi:membrane-associated phospholipid phosphatase